MLVSWRAAHQQQQQQQKSKNIVHKKESDRVQEKQYLSLWISLGNDETRLFN